MNLKTRHCVWWWGGIRVWDRYCTADIADSGVFPLKNTVQKLIFCILDDELTWSSSAQVTDSLRLFIFGKNPRTHHPGRHVSLNNGMWYGCPAHEKAWLIRWHHGDAYLGCMQCHKCHLWSMEGYTVWVRGHCSQYTARGKEWGLRDRMPGQHMVTFGWLSPPPLS